MGRGRAKAKQTKVARELKYRSINTDFSSLEREMRGDAATYDDGQDNEVPDAYDDLAARYESPDDDYRDFRKSG